MPLRKPRNGKRVAAGYVTNNYGNFTVSNLTFAPSMVVLIGDGSNPSDSNRRAYTMLNENPTAALNKYLMGGGEKSYMQYNYNYYSQAPSTTYGATSNFITLGPAGFTYAPEYQLQHNTTIRWLAIE